MHAENYQWARAHVKTSADENYQWARAHVKRSRGMKKERDDPALFLHVSDPIPRLRVNQNLTSCVRTLLPGAMAPTLHSVNLLGQF